ncbi:hypothetical protein SDRG_02436 [Saprolegnia diclina VS20]|uniref:PDZ domain-containing protein n=1 Tax=Saprolegnia diclina (strain VS20) TaxID=1156394 RepID=T0R0T1_SAPDV|nr:hypothetical protein SDRG_02436 [Saprolegnia diclina VS20]EQC40546.1 hypothetical protein SDRG_02436 [Saprolegnia diclina VS20]|eukprot:XP_008606245.1 hypothetical protein SDRG_02436 [Saprolegnia diclina VS20]
MPSLPTSTSTTLVLPPHESFGLVLTPPTSGVVKDGLIVEDVTNPRLKYQVKANDVVAAINGVPFHGLRWDQAVKIIQTTPRPYALTFLHSLSSPLFTPAKREPPSYVAVVERGVQFADAAMHGINGAVVHHLTPEAKADGILATGDVLYKVGEINVLFRPYSVVMGIVAKAARPNVLQFIPHALVADTVRSTLPARARVQLANLKRDAMPEVVSDLASFHQIHGSLKECQLRRSDVKTSSSNRCRVDGATVVPPPY